jgi:large subunit ribosomal protein L25
MKTLEINGSFRNELGKKSSKQLRKDGNVPCVIYEKDQNIHFYTHENSFKDLVYSPDAHVAVLNIDGKVYKAVLKDIQYHPVKDNIIHADFIEVFDDKPLVINIPIKVTGVSVGVLAGGKLSIKKRSLKVKGLACDIPEYVTIDITDLKIHQGVKISDISFDKIELLDPKKSLVLSIATSRVAQKSDETTGETSEAAVPAAAPAAE